MNISMHKRPRLGTVFTTIYFAGVLASSSVMYLHSNEPWYSLAGVTFFSGIVAIYFTARSREEIVVYLEKREEKIKVKDEKNNTSGSQLDGININASYPQHVLNEICKALGAGQGAIYVEEEGELKLKYGYAISEEQSFKLGEGLVGRVAAEKKTLYIDDLPEGYITIFSGLGNATPNRLALIPINSGVIELATFAEINESTLKHIETSCLEILR
jgi:hypothetical protein